MAANHSCQVYDVVLYIGIIDILQEYKCTTWGRKLSLPTSLPSITPCRYLSSQKTIKYKPLSISVVESRFYLGRFLKTRPTNKYNHLSFLLPGKENVKQNQGNAFAVLLHVCVWDRWKKQYIYLSKANIWENYAAVSAPFCMNGSLLGRTFVS